MAKRPLRMVSPIVVLTVLTAWASAPCRPSWGQGAPTPGVVENAAPGEGQLSAADEARLQLLSDPEAAKKATEKARTRPPIEIYRSQVAPNDVIPWLKPHQWYGLTIELQANEGDYDGGLQSLPTFLSPPYEIVFARDARLVKEQRSRLGMPILISRMPKDKELLVELARPGAIRADQLYSAPLRPLPPHQMLVMVLTREGNADYGAWSKYAATIPATADLADTRVVDLIRYYRMLLPLDVDRPLLPTHPLTWAAISHVVWDGMAPDVLNSAQQTAMLDWLHWGGQLVLIGGAGPSYSIFRESFLEPYLPADPTGEGRLLGEADLKPLSESYRPPYRLPSSSESDKPRIPSTPEEYALIRFGYLNPRPIRPAPGRPVYVAGLRPREGAATVPLGEGSADLLAVETRVGRGRITMLTINPNDPALAAWEGVDTMVRRVVFRRPDEAMVRRLRATESYEPQYQNEAMDGADLSWYRIAARDVGPRAYVSPSNERSAPAVAMQRSQTGSTRIDFGATSDEGKIPYLPGVAEWSESTHVPLLCRTLLERASGITVPSSQFVLKVLLAYILAVAPLNWLVCRYVLRRREAAWVIVPLLAFGFAAGVERVAAYDMGYDSACDEIDLLEVQGTFSRGHLSRFASIYATGRGDYAIRFPDNPTALALPLDIGRSIAGEEATTAVWRSFPTPALENFSVQPRSLAMFRSEEITALPGTIALEVDGDETVLRNDLGLELRDATVIDFSDPSAPVETYLGTIAAGATAGLSPEEDRDVPERVEGFDGPDPSELLAMLRRHKENRPEAVGELRLVAWSRGPSAGPTFEPALDRHRGATIVVAHLRYGPPPSPGARHYDSMAPAKAEASRTARPGREENQSS